jgi:hypothetical protein
VKKRINMKKRSIGLYIMTDIRGILHAALQRRGEWNFETDKPESWPNTCQPTMHGRIEAKDRFDEVMLWREGFQEIGPQLTIAVMDQPLTPLYTTDTGAEEIKTYGVKVSFDAIKAISISKSSGGVRFVNKDDLVRLVEIEGSGMTKDVGAVDNRVIAMFQHNANALKRAFEIF